MTFIEWWMRSSRVWKMRSSRVWMRSSQVWMRSRRLWIRSSRLRMRSSQVWIRSSWVVKPSDCQCKRRNGLGFIPASPTQRNLRAADEAVLNNVHKSKNKKSLCKSIITPPPFSQCLTISFLSYLISHVYVWIYILLVGTCQVSGMTEYCLALKICHWHYFLIFIPIFYHMPFADKF